MIAHPKPNDFHGIFSKKIVLHADGFFSDYYPRASVHTTDGQRKGLYLWMVYATKQK